MPDLPGRNNQGEKIMTSRYQRTTAALKAQGMRKYIDYDKAEHWNSFARVKVDLFSIIDLVVLPGGIRGIQVCGSDLPIHKKKIMEEKKENTLAWLKSGARLEVWAWRKLKKKRGGKAMVWAPRIIDILLVNGELYWEERK